MQFKKGELVLILDTLYKPVGTARILGYNQSSTLYAVSFRYPGSNTDEEFEIPERRILIHTDFINPLEYPKSISGTIKNLTAINS